MTNRDVMHSRAVSMILGAGHVTGDRLTVDRAAHLMVSFKLEPNLAVVARARTQMQEDAVRQRAEDLLMNNGLEPGDTLDFERIVAFMAAFVKEELRQ